MRMKRFELSIVTLLILSLSITASASSISNNESYLFRGYEWGTHIGDIAANEIQPGMIEDVDYFFYDTDAERSFSVRTTVSGLDANALFDFDEDWCLMTGAYEITTEHVTPKDYYSDYTTLQSGLYSLYGEPMEKDYLAFNDIDTSSIEEVTNHLINNGGAILEIWCKNNSSGIILMCYATEGVIRPLVIYSENIIEFCESLESMVNTIATEGL